MQSLRNRGFTLTELLVVIAIIIVLAAIAFPFFHAVRYRAHVATSVSNLRQVGAANISYSQDHNGEINGLGNQPLPEFRVNKPVGVSWRVAAYLGATGGGKNGKLRWKDVSGFLREIHHPHIPARLAWGPDGYRWTIAINDRFSLWNDRNAGSFPRMSTIDSPAGTIYACSGIWRFTPEMADDEAYLDLPGDGPRSGPYFTKGRQLPVVYLDGSAALETFPLSRRKLDPDFATN